MDADSNGGNRYYLHGPRGVDRRLGGRSRGGVLLGAAISIWMTGEMLAMLPSSKVSGAGIGSLNQSTLWGRKSLDSTANWVAVLEKDTSGRK